MTMNSKSESKKNSPKKRLLNLLVELRSHLNLKGKNGIYFYAVLSGILAAFVAIFFHWATNSIRILLTSFDGERVVATFMQIEPWRRIFSLVVGGILSGLILLFASKKIKSRATPYMEAVAIGNGHIPVRANLLRSLASIMTVGSGASIGREGPLVQTAAVFASLFGRKIKMPVPRLRLLIACSAAGAMSAVFHTPLAGGLFVCEIVIGVMAMDMLAPLLVASCSSYLTITLVSDTSPLYETVNAHLPNGISLVFYAVGLGILSSLVANLWMRLLTLSRRFLGGAQIWLPLKLALAGLIVGLIAIPFPEVTGNGAHIIREIIAMNFLSDQILPILLLKIFAVALFFGMGAVGGVLTPSLAIGGIFGFLFAHVLMALGIPISPEEVVGLSLLGMAAFFTTAAAAPFTSLVLVLEFTMAGRMIFPLILGVLASYAVAKLLHAKSMYGAETSRSVLAAFGKPLREVRIKDIFRKTSDTVFANTLFGDIAKKFVRNPEESIYVVSRTNRYIGAIFQKDILNFIRSKDVSSTVIADDIMHADIPTLSPDMHLIEAIKIFLENEHYESLPIVDSKMQFYGLVNKSDILIGFNEIITRDRLKS